MPVQHVVGFKYAPTVPWEAISAIATKFLKLADTCKNAAGDKYIRKLVGGKAIANPNGKEIQQTFIVEFESEDDLVYYDVSDPVHDVFRKEVEQLTTDVVVLDFREGKF